MRVLWEKSQPLPMRANCWVDITVLCSSHRYSSTSVESDIQVILSLLEKVGISTMLAASKEMNNSAAVVALEWWHYVIFQPGLSLEVCS